MILCRRDFKHIQFMNNISKFYDYYTTLFLKNSLHILTRARSLDVVHSARYGKARTFYQINGAKLQYLQENWIWYL